MKSISLLASVAAVSALCMAAGCSSKSDSNGAAGGSNGGSGNSTSGGSSNAGSGTTTGGSSNAGSGATTGGSSNAGSGTTVGEAGASSGGSGTIASCSSGVVIEGDPLWNDKSEGGTGGLPASAVVAGQGTLADPPVLPAEKIAIIGNELFLNSEEEIWMADLTGTKPQIKRIAGLRGSKKITADVACADTRFLVVRGIAATADGKLAIVDYLGNAVLEITDPTDATKCASHWVAGTHVSSDEPDMGVVSPGDADGPGNMALFGGDPAVTQVVGAGINRITVDPAGNYYTWDDGTGKVKKIANDAARTVSTIGVLSTDDEVFALTFLNGKLYAIANNAGSENPLFQIDPTTYSATDTMKPSKNIKTLFRIDTDGSGMLFPELNGSGSLALLSDLDNDGTNLIVASSLGFIWKLGTDGSYIATLAGSLAANGEAGRLDFDPGFDPTVANPANMWQLVTSPSSSIGAPWITLNGGSLYWSGGIGIGEYVVKFSCQ
jgi:hypothetical protein